MDEEAKEKRFQEVWGSKDCIYFQMQWDIFLRSLGIKQTTWHLLKLTELIDEVINKQDD